MENKNIILIDEQEREDARALTQSFARADVKSRAYINALGARVLLKYFEQNNISKERTYNLHSVRKILEEFDISDIELSNIHIDVRVIFDENQIFIPKTHFEYNLLPDIYVVLKLAKDHSNTEFLGFFEPKLINKNNANDKYYFIEKEKLSSPVDLKNYIENFKNGKSKNYSEEDISHAEFLMISMADHNVSEEDKKTLLNYLVNSADLRDEFIEFENFEMLSYQASNIVGLELPANKDNVDIASEEVPSDIADDMLAASETDLLTEADIVEEPVDNTGSSEDMIKGAAVLGAEIAGTAMASAALAGAEEAADTTSNIVNAAANVANNVSEAIDMASSIQNMAEQVFADKDLTMPELPQDLNLENIAPADISDISLDEQQTDVPEQAIQAQEQEETAESGIMPENKAPENSSAEAIAPAPSDEISLNDFVAANENQEPASNEISGDLPSDEMSLDDFVNANEEPQMASPQDDLNNSLNELFSDYAQETDNSVQNSSDDLIFSNPDDLVFENSNDDGAISFTNNDYGDDLVFENSDDGYGDYSDHRHSPHPLAVGMHTPISEATELTSLEDIKNGNIPKAVTPPPATEDQMETMGMEEFHNLVKNYVPPEIKDESETISFDNVGGSSAIQMSASTEDTSASKDLSEFTTLPDTVAKPEVNTVTESDPYVEELPGIEANHGMQASVNELTSDDFVEEMPDTTNVSPAMEHADELTSDDFVAEMPDATNVSPAMEHADELTSDDFVAEMPDATNVSPAMEHLDELTSDDFVEDVSILESGNNTGSPEASAQPAQPVDASAILDGLDSISLGELEPSKDQPAADVPELSAEAENMNIPVDEGISAAENSDIEICEESTEAEDEKLQVLYDDSAVPELESLEDSLDIESDEQQAENEENYDFRPERKIGKLMPVFAILAAIIIAGSVVGFLMKSKNSIDAETLIQTTPENEAIATPEADNSDILANTGELDTPNIPSDAADISPSAPVIPQDVKEDKPAAKPAEQKPAAAAKPVQKPAVTKPAVPKPINSSKTITLKKLSWQVPDYLSYSSNINDYLQTAGKSIKLTLSSDLLLTNEYIYSNQVKVDINLTKDGNVTNAKIAKSSGSEQVDKIVLQTVKDTLNVVKPARGEVPTPNYNLALIIYL